MDRFLRESLMFQVFHNSKLSNAIEKTEERKLRAYPTHSLISSIVNTTESLWMIYFAVAQRSSNSRALDSGNFATRS